MRGKVGKLIGLVRKLDMEMRVGADVPRANRVGMNVLQCFVYRTDARNELRKGNAAAPGPRRRQHQAGHQAGKDSTNARGRYPSSP